MNFENEFAQSKVGDRGLCGVSGIDQRFQFGSKAQTLERVRHGSRFRVLPAHRVTYRNWCRNAEREIARVQERFGLSLVIVRSSACGEDGSRESRAGEFDSVLDVPPTQVGAAIERVFRSYGVPVDEDEVLIQPMAEELLASGVAMTCDPLTGAPYFVVDYQDGTDTEIVTGGGATSSWTLVRGRDVDVPERVARVVEALEELMCMTGERNLDVEFGVTGEDETVVFQVRRVTTVGSSGRVAAKRASRLDKAVDRALLQFGLAQPHSRHCGVDHSLLGVMPDWNPAELIGLKPRPLAYSLYESLITSDAWAAGRSCLGYKNLRAVPLMHRVGGTPYILVAASLRSFVPEPVPESVAKTIVETAQRRLHSAPELHDKVEFAVMPTCFKPSLRTEEWRGRFPSVSEKDWTRFVDELLRLTNRIIGDEHVISSALERADGLDEAVGRMRAELDGSEHAVDAVALLRSARVHGTELFSEVARAAFIATDILSDLESSGALTSGSLDQIVASASTVGSRLVEEHSTLSVEEFLRLHGHIRPGTYDVTVPRYDASPDSYFEAARPGTFSPGVQVSTPSRELDAVLADSGYEFSWERLVYFAQTAISLREEVKHSFTKLVSDAMEILVRDGARSDLDRDQVSFLTLEDVKQADDHPSQRRRLLNRSISRNRKRWRQDLAVRLPDLLIDHDDILFSEERVSRPTFVTAKRIQAPVRTPDDAEIRGSVVFIERADPGYDWLFTRGIAGIVTRFGGENSHMAIRARELGVPAVLGAGGRFDRWFSATQIVIDGHTRTVEVVA